MIYVLGYFLIALLVLLIIPLTEPYTETNIGSAFGMAILWPISLCLFGWIIPVVIYRKYWEWIDNLKFERAFNKTRINLTKPSRGSNDCGPR